MLRKSIVLIILLVALLITVKLLQFPEKVLVVGNQIDDNCFEFTYQIKDKDKILEFEELFNTVKFEKEKLSLGTYPDVIVQLNHPEGYFTHAFSIWFRDKKGIVIIRSTENKEVGELTNIQASELKKIIGYKELD